MYRKLKFRSTFFENLILFGNFDTFVVVIFVEQKMVKPDRKRLIKIRENVKTTTKQKLKILN